MSFDIDAMRSLLHDLDGFKNQLESDLEYAKKSGDMGGLTDTLTAYLEEFSGIPGRYYDFYLEAKKERETPALSVQPLDRETGKYPEHIMRDVRENLGLESDDTSRDDEIMAMSRNEVFEHVQEWDGLICYGHKIRSWVEDIYGIDLSKLPSRERPEPELPLDRDVTVGKWRVAFVAPGENFGAGHRLPNKYDKPVVEFFDMSQDRTRFPFGQFVSSYFAETLIGKGPLSTDFRTEHSGLCLDADISAWSVSAQDMKTIANWIGRKVDVYNKNLFEHQTESLSEMMADADKRRVSTGAFDTAKIKDDRDI